MDAGVGAGVGAGVVVVVVGTFLKRRSSDLGGDSGTHAPSSAAVQGPDRQVFPPCQPHPLASPQKWFVIAAQFP